MSEPRAQGHGAMQVSVRISVSSLAGIRRDTALLSGTVTNFFFDLAQMAPIAPERIARIDVASAGLVRGLLASSGNRAVGLQFDVVMDGDDVVVGVMPR